MKIQFVCKGNTFRSRLAEAYLKSKNMPDLIVSSSGIEAEKNLNGPVCFYTVDILKKYNLIQYLSKHWRVTDKKDLEEQDLLIFMDSLEYEFCLNELHCDISNYEIWDIPDIPDEFLIPNHKDAKKIIAIAEGDFEKIKAKVDTLVGSKMLI